MKVLGHLYLNQDDIQGAEVGSDIGWFLGLNGSWD